MRGYFLDVSNAGGFGVLGASGMPAERVREAIRTTRALTDRPFGVNVIIDEEDDADRELILDGMRGDQSWRERQTWSLGRWSRPLAWLSVIWIVLFSPVFLYPFALNPSSWLIVGTFLVLLACVIWS